MSSRTPRPSSRRAARQPEPEASYPYVPEPRQGHAGHLLAFASVLAVLGFGFWAAIGTLVAYEEKPAPKALPTSALPTSTAVPTAVPTLQMASAVGTPSGSAAPTPGGARVHVIGQGDTLYKISRQYGTTVDAIMAANGFEDRSKILHIGERLTIP